MRFVRDKTVTTRARNDFHLPFVLCSICRSVPTTELPPSRSGRRTRSSNRRWFAEEERIESKFLAEDEDFRSSSPRFEKKSYV